MIDYMMMLLIGAGDGGYAHPEMLAETEWLSAHLDDAEVRVVDLRSREAYEAGHVPGAVRLDTDWFRDAGHPPEYLPPAEEVRRQMGAAGVGAESCLVAYDGQGGTGAARLWWLLDLYGFPRTRLLNGMWQKWLAEGRPISRETPEPRPTDFPVTAQSGRVCAVPQLLSRLNEAQFVVIDTRSDEEYSGAEVRAQRGGHIPHAVHIEWRRHLAPGDLPVFRPAAELGQLFADAGVTRDKTIVTY
jgi:thiosulfate/3-mercaptopyruvate sulfurtransferase